MHNRIKQVREALRLSQREFGENMGLSRDVISNIEYNRVEAKELFIKHLCQIYYVNEAWLKTGQGDMFQKHRRPNEKLDEAMRIFDHLNPDFQEYALEQIRKLAQLQQSQ